jgi:hypothetical protein
MVQRHFNEINAFAPVAIAVLFITRSKIEVQLEEMSMSKVTALSVSIALLWWIVGFLSIRSISWFRFGLGWFYRLG